MKIEKLLRSFKSFYNNLRQIKQSTFFINLFSVTGATLFSRLIGLSVLGYTARVLGPENYGLYAFGISIAAYSGVLIAPGLLTWGSRAVARDPKKAGTYLTTLNIVQLMLAVLGFIILVLYSQLFLQGSERIIVLLCALRLFASALSVDFVFNGLEMMRVPAILNIFTEILNIIALVTIIKAPDDVYKIPILSFSISLILILAEYYWLFFRTKITLHLPDFFEFRSMLTAAIPLSVTSLLIIILHYANNLIVKEYLGTAALGVFYSAFRLVELAIIVPGILGGVFIPRLSRLVLTDSKTAQREALSFAQVNMFLAFLIGGLFFIEAPGIINFIYGTRYVGAINLLRIMSVSVIFNFAINGYTNCLISFGKDKVMILVVVASAFISVGCGLILVPRIGLIGAAITISLVDLAGWLISLPYYKKIIGSFQFEAWKKPIIATVISGMIGGLLQLSFLPFILQSMIVVIVYFMILRNEIKELIGNLK
jgi:O-antigen/teichoic acid export membrane protein